MTMTRRVALVCPAASGADGDRWLLDVAQGLLARGHKIKVIGPEESPFLGAAARSGLPVAFVPFPGTSRALDPRIVIPLWQTLRAWRAQVAIVDHEHPLHPLVAARFLLGLRTVAALAPSLPLPVGASPPRPGRRIHHLVVHSPEVLGALLAHHGTGLDMKRTCVIPRAVDTAATGTIDRKSARRGLRRDLGLTETQPIVAIAGDSLSSTERPAIVVEALARLGAAAPKPVWLGEPGLPPNPNPNPTRVLTGADLLVIASPNHPLPTLPLQAMALEVPVVAVAAGEYRSLLGGQELAGGEPARGLLFPPGDAPALAEAIGGVLGNPELTRHRAAVARTHVMLHHELRQVIGVWEELLGAGHLVSGGNRGNNRASSRAP